MSLCEADGFVNKADATQKHPQIYTIFIYLQGIGVSLSRFFRVWCGISYFNIHNYEW
jgi:hypothetical protein